jgi:hypothetical protein
MSEPCTADWVPDFGPSPDDHPEPKKCVCCEKSKVWFSYDNVCNDCASTAAMHLNHDEKPERRVRPHGDAKRCTDYALAHIDDIDWNALHVEDTNYLTYITCHGAGEYDNGLQYSDYPSRLYHEKYLGSTRSGKYHVDYNPDDPCTFLRGDNVYEHSPTTDGRWAGTEMFPIAFQEHIRSEIMGKTLAEANTVAEEWGLYFHDTNGLTLAYFCRERVKGFIDDVSNVVTRWGGFG